MSNREALKNSQMNQNEEMEDEENSQGSEQPDNENEEDHEDQEENEEGEEGEEDNEEGEEEEGDEGEHELEGEHDQERNMHQEMVHQQEVIPENKDDLIEFLRNKLDKTNSTIQEAFALLQKEKQETGDLVYEFEVQKKELAKIQQRENRPIKDKVHEKIEQTLEKAIQDKVEAENLRNETKAVSAEKYMMIEELDWTLRNLNIENNMRERELEEFQRRVAEYDDMIERLGIQKEQLEQEGEQKSEEIQQLLKERDRMRGVLYKLSDVKIVLNRLLGNPQLLYENAGNVGNVNHAHAPISGEQQLDRSTHARTPQNIHMNKPNYLVNEEDFWYADPNKEAYGKDYGGREQNYNQQYFYNQKMQNEPQTLEQKNMHNESNTSQSNLLPPLKTNKH